MRLNDDATIRRITPGRSPLLINAKFESPETEMNILTDVSSHWQFWAFLSALAAALTAIFAKLGVQEISPDVATFVRTIVIFCVVLTILLITNQFGELKTLSRRALAFLTISGIATGASWICYFRALDIGKAAQVASIDKLSVVMVAIIGFIFLSEKLSLSAVVGVALIAIGAILVARN